VGLLVHFLTETDQKKPKRHGDCDIRLMAVIFADFVMGTQIAVCSLALTRPE